jgi:hypothetical protein
LVHHRGTLATEPARQAQHMQTALVQMDLQLSEVLSDVVGASGQAIIRAIVGGQRDAHKLAALCGGCGPRLFVSPITLFNYLKRTGHRLDATPSQRYAPALEPSCNT